MAVQNGTAEISRVLHALEQGNIMVRFIRGKKQPLKKLFCLREDTFEILQYPIQRGKSTAAEESSRSLLTQWVGPSCNRSDSVVTKIT